MSLPMESNPLMVTNLVNNQGQCAGGRNGGRLGAFLVCSHVRSSTVTDGDGDEGGKKR